MEQKENKLLSDYIVKVFPFAVKVFKKFPWIMQFINFSLVGVINLFLSYGLYALFIALNFHYQVANQLSFWLSVLNGYILNSFWVFRKQVVKRTLAQSIKYFATYGFNMILGIVLLYLYVDVLHINKYIAPIISMPITIPLNFIIVKFWVFRNRKENSDGMFIEKK